MAISTSVFCPPKKHIIFSANPTWIFIVGYNNLAFCCLQRCTYTTPYSGLKIVSFKIFGHCSAQKFEMAFFSGFSSTPL